MTRKTPAGFRAATWPLLLGVIALTFLLKACAEQPPTETTAVTNTPQLAAGGATCTAPCVEVEVKAKPGNATAAGVLVTLVQGGLSGVGPFDQSAEPLPLMKLTDANGVAVFGPDDPNNNFDLIGQALELGYCAHVRPLTSETDATGGGSFIVPNGTPPSPSADLQSTVTGRNLKSEVLTKKSYLDNCVSWTDADDAPFKITPTTAVRVSITANATGATLGVRCRFFDGGTAPTGSNDDECPTWTLIDLNDEGLPWTRPDLEDGVRVGLLVSGSSTTNAANNNGLAFDETYEVEAALQGDDKQYTASLTNKKTAKGGRKDGTVTSETADLDPLVCVEVSEPAESEGEVTTGVDFLSPMRDGYLGFTPLNSALFVADAEHVTIYYDQKYYGGGGSVQLHMRAKQNPLFDPDGFSSTMNKVVTYDFAACPSLQPTKVGESGSAELVVEVECRVDPGDPTITHVVWSITIPGSRLVEWRLQTPFDESHPEEARNDDTRAMRPIAFPVGADGQIWPGPPEVNDDCPLANSTIGKSNDPKWDITG